MLAVYAGLLVLIAGVIGVTTLIWLNSATSDRLAVISNLLAFGTLLLALVAGIVALAAYSAATGLPDLKVKITFPAGGPNSLSLHMGEMQSRTITDEFIVAVVVRNCSTFAARTPAMPCSWT